MRKRLMKIFSGFFVLALALVMTGCSASNGKRIIRIAHAQSETHPEHLGLLKFNLNNSPKTENGRKHLY